LLNDDRTICRGNLSIANRSVEQLEGALCAAAVRLDFERSLSVVNGTGDDAVLAQQIGDSAFSLAYRLSSTPSSFAPASTISGAMPDDQAARSECGRS